MDGRHGEVVLRRRWSDGSAIEELIVDGVFAMDSEQTGSERELGRIAARVSASGHVLVGGLGLGYTVAELCRYRIDRGDVVELEPALIDWAHAGLTATLRQVSRDSRVHCSVGDVTEVLLGRRPDLSGPWHAILLDVDNGPDFLIHPGNAALYSADVLAGGLDRLTPGGVLAIWCQGSSRRLEHTLGTLGGAVTRQDIPVRRGSRATTEVIYTVASNPMQPARPAGSQ